MSQIRKIGFFLLLILAPLIGALILPDAIENYYQNKSYERDLEFYLLCDFTDEFLKFSGYSSKENCQLLHEMLLKQQNEECTAKFADDLSFEYKEIKPYIKDCLAGWLKMQGVEKAFEIRKFTKKNPGEAVFTGGGGDFD